MSFCIISSYSFNLLFFTQVLTVFTSTITFNEYITDVGSNISIPCLAEGTIMWIKEDCQGIRVVQRGKNLTLYNIEPDDAGTYMCLISLYDNADMMGTDNDYTSNAIDFDSSSTTTIDIETEFSKELMLTLKVRSRPGPVANLTVRISTILGVLKWDFEKNNTGGYPLKSFTAQFRKYVNMDTTNCTNSNQSEWDRLDPRNIPSNVRYLEVYHLMPNTSYEFRIWANNILGAGEISYTTATTLDKLTDERLLEVILRNVQDFDPRIWVYAVSISMSALIVLGCTVCILLLRDHYDELERRRQQEEDEWDAIELVPNIILNPGYYEPEDPNNSSPIYTRTIIFGEDVLSSSESESEDEQMTFKRKVSLFFTGDTIKRL